MAAPSSAFVSKALSCLLLLVAAGSLLSLDETGYSRLLASKRGKVVVIDFWATWCEPCREEMPVLIGLQKKFGFELATVSADEPEQEETARDFLVSISAPMPAWIKRPRNDEGFINAVDPKWSGALPAVFIYNRAGQLTESLIGESGTGALEKAIRKVMGASR